MADDSMMMKQPRPIKLNEKIDPDATSTELRQLLDMANQLMAGLGSKVQRKEVQPAFDDTIPETLPRVPQSDETRRPAADFKDVDSHNAEDAKSERDRDRTGWNPYNRYLT